MKGYRNPYVEYKPVVEPTLVGCRRCMNAWYEDRIHTSGMRINGAIYSYDYCDKCKTENEEPSKPEAGE